jgi:hypothetical protein
MARTAVPVTELTPAKAALTTALAGANNDLVFTAKKGGTWGNSIQVAYIDPGGTTATLSIVVTGFLITVNLGRTASAIDTTATALSTAIAASADASALVTVANSGADDGTGLVIALTATSLAGGEWAVTLPAVTNGDATNDHYVAGGADGKTAVRVVSSDAGSQTVTVKRSPLLRAGAPPSDEVITVAAGATRELGTFPAAEFRQNAAGDLYFDPSVSNTLDFVAYRVTAVTT